MRWRVVIGLVVLAMMLLELAHAAAQSEARITLKDFEGVKPLAGAKVVVIDAANRADRREYHASDDGIVVIPGIRAAARYVLEVYWEGSRFAAGSALVLRREVWGGELLAAEEVRAHVFKASIMPVTASGGELALLANPVKGKVFERFAGIYLDGVELVRGEPLQFTPMSAEAEMVPQGAHGLEVWWAGYKVYDGEIYVGLDHLRGYIPGIDDPDHYKEELKKLKIRVTTNTTEFRLLVTYMGEGVRTAVDIVDEDERFSLGYFTRPHPVWIAPVPIVPLKLRVESHYTWEELAEGSCMPDPEKICEVVIPPEKGPFYTIRVRITSREGAPLMGARVELDGWSERTNDEGVATFYLVRPGRRSLKASFGEVFAERAIEVRGPEEVAIALDLKPVRVDMQFVTWDHKPCEVYWVLEGSGGLRFDSGGRPSSRMVIESLPAGKYTLRLRLPETGLEYVMVVANYLDLAKDKFLVPIGDVRMRFLLDGVEPIANAAVKLTTDGVSFNSTTDGLGEALFERLPLQRTYDVELSWGGGYSYAGKLRVVVDLEMTVNIPSDEVRKPVAVTVTKTERETAWTTIAQVVVEYRISTETVTTTERSAITTTKTVTTTETAEVVAKRVTVPIIPIMAAAIAAAIIASAAIAARRWAR
ncbi:MAG: carboxypeptidase-like regulatory domain-containing protein [Nitrososphaerota archaeon]